ncbi:MAG: V-type ATP synthase subunit D [Spirochaetales bacterium]|jgi:V/A-type H+-transporting ATPase subunit D|nr:V-type ATP synthase subunit D [Spirochaetales bacterium]
MPAIKFTKNELKKQKDGLKRFERYLPTLQLKKQQLQMVIRSVEQQEREKRAAREAAKKRIEAWVELFGETGDIAGLVKISRLETETGNIAGVDIPVFKAIEYEDISFDLFETPLWFDAGVEALKKLIAFNEELKILQKQVELLNQELRITSQRVNLFEKVKIPETKNNIRKIRIYLGDQQTAAVVRGKIAKKKIIVEKVS